jgi:hypothetical protein
MGHKPTRTPLTSITDVGTHKGRRILEATYPSATTAEIWTCTFDDSGHVIGCTCPAGRNQHACWHTNDAPAAVVEYFKRVRADLNERQLADQAEHLQRYLSFPQDAEERECAELEAIAIRQLRAAKEEAA